MKLIPICRPCLERLVHQVAQISTTNSEMQDKAIETGLDILNKTFSPEISAPQVATEIHRAIQELTGNPDPYRQMKDRELEMAGSLCQEVRPYYGEDLQSCIKLSTIGNTIDFFKEHDRVSREIKKNIAFDKDHIEAVEEKIRSAKKVLFLADNAGECFFDIPLLKKMRETAQVIYVVKGSPVQDDITLEDLRQVGLMEEIGEVMTTGAATVGIDFTSASEDLKAKFEQADLILAKGMGNYETLSNIPIHGKIIYCLMAKCQPVADSLKVPLNSYVVQLR